MQMEIRIDPTCKEPRVIVLTDRMTDEVRELAERIGGTPTRVIGFRDGEATVLSEEQIVRIYAENGRTMATTADGVYTLRGALYEWERRLNPQMFVRISQSEIVSLNKVRGFDLSLAGTICMRLTDGTVTYTSRRYVAKIKTMLGL